MATPALAALRQRFPKAEITAVLRPYVAGVLEGTSLVDHLLALPKRGGLFTIRQLRAARLDLAVLFPNSIRSALWARLSGASRRVGFDRSGRGLLLTDRIQSFPDDQP